jgi:hypothetical protein
MNALADAALARQLQKLDLCFSPPPAPEPLARLLARGWLSHLGLWFTATAPLFDAAGAAVMADALRATTALTSLELCRAELCSDLPAAAAVLSALVGHHSLRTLILCAEEVADVDAAPLGAALAALVAADAPALQELSVRGSTLGDAGLAPLMDALPRNHHLRSLCLVLTDMSEQFARERLLPAVRANTSLRALDCGSEDMPNDAAAKEAEELVRQR